MPPAKDYFGGYHPLVDRPQRSRVALYLLGLLLRQ